MASAFDLAFGASQPSSDDNSFAATSATAHPTFGGSVSTKIYNNNDDDALSAGPSCSPSFSPSSFPSADNCDDVVWRDHPGGSSFRFAPKTSAVVLGTFFGLSVVVFAKITKSTRYAILLAASLTLTASIGFLVGGDIGFDLSVGSCQSFTFINIAFGFLYGLALTYTIMLIQILIEFTSTAARIRRMYLDSAIPLRGTIVNKSYIYDKPAYSSTLHIRYNLRPYCSSTNNCEELELGAIVRSKTKETIKTSRKVSPLGLECPSLNLPPRVQWYWKETLNMMSEQHDTQNDDQNRWINYSDDCNSLLETAFQEGSVYSPAIMDCCIVDFSAMIQTNAATGLQQKVKRTIIRMDGCGDSFRHQKANEPNEKPLQQEQQLDAYISDSHYVLPIPTPGELGRDGDHQTFSDVEKPYQQHQENECNYRNEETFTIYPFKVARITYDKLQIGDTVELTWLPGIPVSVKVKTELERSGYNSYICGVILGSLIFLCPLPLLLGFYLPTRILNWEICLESVIVRMSTMVLALVPMSLASILNHDLTTLQAKKIIQKQRDQMIQQLASDEGLQQLCNAALMSLEKEVICSLDSTVDGTDEWTFTEVDLRTLLRNTLLQAKVSSGRCIPGLVVIQARDRERELLERGKKLQLQSEANGEELVACREVSKF